MGYRKIYDNYFTMHLSRSFSLEKLPLEYDKAYHFWRQRYIRKYLHESKEIKIVELGCGLGHNLYALKRLGYVDLQGIDISQEQIGIAREHLKGVELLAANAFDFLPKQKEKYDMIIMFDLLEHMKKDEAFEICKLSHNILRGGGRLFIRTPNALNPLSLCSIYEDFTHENPYTKRSLRELLIFVGFTRIEIIGVKSRNILLRPLTWLSAIPLKLMYLSQGKPTETLRPSLFGVATK